MGIDFSKDFTEAELNVWWDWLSGGGQMTDEDDVVKFETPVPKAKKVSKRPKKGKKSLRRIRVDNARRRGR